ncbi:hypothetical protein BN1708_010956, partial [Verticillium longisporum]
MVGIGRVGCDFYGQGKTVDTRSKFTVISRFRDNVSEQVFIQNGNVIIPPKPTLAGLTQFNAAITPEFCTAYPTIFGDRNRHDEIGGHTQLNAAYRLPMVLVLSPPPAALPLPSGAMPVSGSPRARLFLLKKRFRGWLSGPLPLAPPLHLPLLVLLHLRLCGAPSPGGAGVSPAAR